MHYIGLACGIWSIVPTMCILVYHFFGGPSINYVRNEGEGGVKPPIHFHCVLHGKRGGGGQDSR